MNPEFFAELEQLMMEGKYAEVIEIIQQLDEDDMTPELYVMYAHALSQCSNYKQALQALETIREDVYDDDISYYLELAGAHYGLHHYHAALDALDKCIEANESCSDAWILRALIYQDTGNEEKFSHASQIARELDEEAWQQVFGSKNEFLEQYSEEDMTAILEHIHQRFGKIAAVFPLISDDEEQEQHPINVVIVPPSKSRNFYSLVSVGIGAYRSHDVTEDGDPIIHRIEMAAFLPPYFTMEEMTIKYYWVAKIMRQFGEMIQLEDTWLDYGHSISYGGPLDESVDFDGVVFDMVRINDDLIGELCILPGGEPVRFLEMRPVFEEEMLYKIENGHQALFDKLDSLPKHGYAFDRITARNEKFIDIIDTMRSNACPKTAEKKWAIPRSGLVQLLDWEGADGCFVTDRIMVDNCPVGFMYRERPYPGQPDSGWRFLAGDEDQEYMNNTDNMGIFSLNTVCNYDPDIIELLEHPVGTAFYRNKDGEFIQVRP